MKKSQIKNILRDIFYILVLMAACITLDAQSDVLNINALALKNSEDSKHYDNIKLLCENEWKGDHNMMIYTINKQADAVFEIIGYMKSPKFDEMIFATAFHEWTKKDLTDWTMVVYVYKNQLKAKGDY